jgi:hypothetical protein
MVSDVEFQPFGRANCWGLAEITSSQSNIWDASYKTWGVKKNNHGIQETQRFFFCVFHRIYDPIISGLAQFDRHLGFQMG